MPVVLDPVQTADVPADRPPRSRMTRARFRASHVSVVVRTVPVTALTALTAVRGRVVVREVCGLALPAVETARLGTDD